jgi:CheY-like chemotaxis protein
MKSICVIDDDEIYQLIIKKVIDRTGLFAVKTCYLSAGEALEMFSLPAIPLPDMILLDINMPGMDGWQFIENLSKSRPGFMHETKIYIVTSSIANSDRVKADSYKEISGFMSKPVSVERLKAIAETKANLDNS